jgi:hypothetical protein
MIRLLRIQIWQHFSGDRHQSIRAGRVDCYAVAMCKDFPPASANPSEAVHLGIRNDSFRRGYNKRTDLAARAVVG